MRVRTALTQVLERAYATETNEGVWLQGIRQAVSHAFDGLVDTQAYTAQLTQEGGVKFGSIAGDNEMSNDFMSRMHAAASSEVIRKWYRSGPVVSILGSIPSGGHDELSALYRQARKTIGNSNVIGAVATDPSGRLCAVTLLPVESRPLSRTTRLALSRIAAHLAAGYRLRGRSEPDHGNVLSPDGRLLHADRDEPTRDELASLRSAAIAIERSRRDASTDPAQALAYWKAMVMGRWTLIERFESDGRRILIARPNAPDAHAYRALSERERKVVSLAALGHPSKLIAYELGFSFSMVSRVLARALEKLGIRSRLELVEVHGAIVGKTETSSDEADDPKSE